ncbi:MAG: Inner membrane transport permease YbhR [Candidatus Ordinivivax streblomastigis]|uniref:Inner membrane transport permease YbhR n=1 Tax=Candidatus Ordinivivax streblomastigis TaxID=2540710 RepID=A0A5M8P3F8_9BACT|nr:MAG: Inner membrane transport permease YbhR [Candidatus Ordinivivax streblomastigis]
MLNYLIQKEFKQIFRNSFIPKILVALPLMVILVFPWAANQEITNIKVDVVDRDHSASSRRLTEKIAASSYFQLTTLSKRYETALEQIADGKADIILEIQPGFEKALMVTGAAEVRISSNAVNIMKGGLGSGYMSQIVQDFASELRSEYLPAAGKSALPVIQIVSQNRFNPFSDYKVFMIPALLVMLLTIICGFLPTLNIVSEKEIGTIEQINVTPVSKIAFILSKLIPNWIMGLVIMTIYLLLAYFVYGLSPAGNILTVYFFALIYIFVVSGLGLVISNYSSTVQQAMFMMFFFMIIMIMLSGLFTPIASMPYWAQHLTLFNPLRYFIEIMRMVYLKGSSVFQLGNQFAALMVFALLLNGLAVVSYHKNR